MYSTKYRISKNVETISRIKCRLYSIFGNALLLIVLHYVIFCKQYVLSTFCLFTLSVFVLHFVILDSTLCLVTQSTKLSAKWLIQYTNLQNQPFSCQKRQTDILLSFFFASRDECQPLTFSGIYCQTRLHNKRK